MSTQHTEHAGERRDEHATTRLGFLKGAAATGAGAAGLGALGPAAAFAQEAPARPDQGRRRNPQGGPDRRGAGGHDVLQHHRTAPFFKNLESDDQGYLKAALQEEMSHFLLEESLTRKPAGFTTFYYPPKMFADAQTTLNTLVTLEDAFIAAYLVGVREFSTADLRVTAARIMGIESDHRTLARVVAPGVAAVRRRPDRGGHGHPEDGGVGRPAQQQRLRADARAEEHRPGRRSAAALRGTEGRRKSRLRRDQAVQVPAVHADAARHPRRVPLGQGLSR